MNGEEELVEETVDEESMKRRRNLTGFWGKFKDGIIDLFKEEDKAF
jgi:cell division protein FtsA